MLVGFGGSQAGLQTVAFELLSASGEVVTPRTSEGVIELGGGWYAAQPTVPNEAKFIKWDTGTMRPYVALEELSLASASRDTDILNLLETLLRRVSAGAQTPIQTVGATGLKKVVAPGAIITIIRGDDYAASEGRAWQFAAPGTDLAGASVWLVVQKGARTLARWACVAQRDVLTGEQFVQLELTAAQTGQFELGLYQADLEASYLNGHHVTVWRRPVSVVSE